MDAKRGKVSEPASERIETLVDVPEANAHPVATILLTTKNRCSDLKRAIRSACQQDLPLEILVIDDGSTDGTAEMVSSLFPNVRLIRSESSQGYIWARNYGASLARGEVLFSIDDDAEFSAPDVVRRTLEDFDANSRIGAVAIPCIDVNRSSQVRQPFPPDGQAYITSEYIGTAHALRRDLFLRLNGYRERLVHQGEERDFCLRLLNAGYVVRLGTAPPILHYESPRRNTQRMDHYGRRNDVLFALYNVPMPRVFWHAIGTVAKGLAFGMRHRRPFVMAGGIVAGWSDGLADLKERKPVSREAYCLHRRIRRRGYMRLSDAVRQLDAV